MLNFKFLTQIILFKKFAKNKLSKKNSKNTENQYQMLKKLSLSHFEFNNLIKYCKNKN